MVSNRPEHQTRNPTEPRPSTQTGTDRNVGPAGVAPAASITSTPRLAHSASKGQPRVLGDSDSNRDCTAPKAGGLPITPSPTGWTEPRPALRGYYGCREPPLTRISKVTHP